MFGITPVHLHLLINHSPVFGEMAAVLLLLWAMLRKTAELERTALMTFVLTALLAWGADATGDGAAHVAKNIAAINRADVREHSQSADTSLLISEIAGLAALVGLILAWVSKRAENETNPRAFIRWHKSPPRWIVVVVLILGCVDIYFLSITAYTGGEIRHPEIRTGYQPPIPPPLPGIPK